MVTTVVESKRHWMRTDFLHEESTRRRMQMTFFAR